jgi:hypothetical protein
MHGISVNAGKKVKAAINMLAWLADDKPIFPDDKNCNIFFKLNFLTLTLPSNQVHTDEQIKKLILDPFIKSCKYHFGLNNYFWKAEVQNNQRIHFHITTDCYMDKDKVRSLWNHQLNRYGYIEAYRANQIEKHRDGFYFDKNQTFINFKTNVKSKICFQTQKAAFKKGTAENWSNPNSTDIHPVLNINNIAAYVCAYLSKKDLWKSDISGENKREIIRMEKQGIPLADIQKKFPECIKRSISGKLWDCSANLKKTGLKIENIEQYQAEFDNMKQFNVEKVLQHDHCTIYITSKEFEKMYPPAIADLVRDYYELRKYDCMNIKDYYLNLQHEKEIQKLLAPSPGSSTAENKMYEHHRFRRIQNFRRRPRASEQHRQTSLQLRY